MQDYTVLLNNRAYTHTNTGTIQLQLANQKGVTTKNYRHHDKKVANVDHLHNTCNWKPVAMQTLTQQLTRNTHTCNGKERPCQMSTPRILHNKNTNTNNYMNNQLTFTQYSNKIYTPGIPNIKKVNTNNQLTHTQHSMVTLTNVKYTHTWNTK